MRRSLLAVVALTLAAPAGPALAWGGSGHRMIGQAAARALPAELPAFLHKRSVPDDIGELSREPDRIKGAGKQSDDDHSPGHFLDLDDDGKVLGGPPLVALPANRALYEKALQGAGTDSWKAGYLPYSIIETWQRLKLDFAVWRIATAGAQTSHDHRQRAWLKADARRREALVLEDIGLLSHFVGDGSQPLHVTLHYNGWGDYPNPDGFTTDKVHAPFESDFVAAHVSEPEIEAKLSAFHDCACPIEQRTAGYLAATGAQMRPFYSLWKDGGFKDGDSRGHDFAVERIAAGASELRDLVVLAWSGSNAAKVGYPSATPDEVGAGKADAYLLLHGND
jgi:hypothetical protein